MTMPVQSLPVVPNWDCHSCGNCCRDYVVHVSDEERRRIMAQNWDQEADLRGARLIERLGWFGRGGLRLAHRDGGCIFLDSRGMCRIHAKFGAAAKPLACRVYPFILVPAGDHWNVGLRFACPSVAEEKGQSITRHRNDIREYAAILEKQNPAVLSLPVPPLKGSQRVSWPDLQLFVDALCAIVANKADRMESRLRKCLALGKLCLQAKFDKVTGGRLREFLELISQAVDAETPIDVGSLAPPSGVGRLLFRQHLALAIRKDHGPEAGVAVRGRAALLVAAVRFARGRGRVPKIHGALPETTFEKLEEPAGITPVECEDLLERYYLTKLTSLQFVGPTNFNASLWGGFESLVLTFPTICWLARAFHDLPRVEAMRRALRIVDDSFGYQPMMGTGRQSLALRILSFRGELDRLIAWYSR